MPPRKTDHLPCLARRSLDLATGSLVKRTLAGIPAAFSAAIVALFAVVSTAVPAAEPRPAPLTRDQVIAETMRPYTGPSVAGVDPSTMTGKVLCGYQGWFAAEGDGCGRGWYHWHGKDGFKPGS